MPTTTPITAPPATKPTTEPRTTPFGVPGVPEAPTVSPERAPSTPCQPRSVLQNLHTP
jgi:hypothetical protein